MRPVLLLMLLLATTAALAACGGPKDPEKSLKAACERQIEELEAEAEDGGATAGSTEEADEAESLSECAGQPSLTASDSEGGESGEEGDEGEEQPAEGGEEQPTEGGGEIDPKARELFVSKCGSCHALSDAGTSSQVGPNLDETDMDTEAIREQIEEGGGGMPPNLAEGEEADAIAAYVDAASEG